MEVSNNTLLTSVFSSGQQEVSVGINVHNDFTPVLILTTYAPSSSHRQIYLGSNEVFSFFNLRNLMLHYLNDTDTITGEKIGEIRNIKLTDNCEMKFTKSKNKTKQIGLKYVCYKKCFNISKSFLSFIFQLESVITTKLELLLSLDVKGKYIDCLHKLVENDVDDFKIIVSDVEDQNVKLALIEMYYFFKNYVLRDVACVKLYNKK